MDKVELSFENSRRLTEHSVNMHKAINELFYNGFRESREKVVSEVNKAIYELAEKRRVSIYDICFNCIPVESFSEPKIEEVDEPLKASASITSEVKLVPIKFEFEKGPGYWKQKYYELKKEMQKLIDSK